MRVSAIRPDARGEQLRVAFTAHLSELSGSGVALVETVAGLSAQGIDARLILPGPGPLMDRAVGRGIRPVIIANPQRAITEASALGKLKMAVDRLGYVNNLRRYFKSEGIGLVYVNSSASVFPGLAARLAGLPIAWHIHETLAGTDRRTRWKKRLIGKWASGLVYASQSGLEHLPPGDGVPHLIARNFVDVNALAALRAQHLSERDGDSVFQIGANGAYRLKGGDILLRALREVLRREPGLDFRLIIAGPTDVDPEFYTELQELAGSEELRGRVEFPGMVKSLGPLLASADLFVSASRNEAMPIAIVEAMAAGAPVVATDVGDCRGLLDDGKCGWIVAPENETALADAILEAMNRRDVAAEKSAAAFTRVEELYAPENFWVPLIDFINSLPNKR